LSSLFALEDWLIFGAFSAIRNVGRGMIAASRRKGLRE
jgi:hypothetical protein